MSANALGIFHAIASFVVALIALLWTYPWSLYQTSFEFPWQHTSASYVVLAFLMTLGCSVVPWWLAITRSGDGTSPSQFRTALLFFLFALAGVFALILIFGGVGLGLDLPGTRIHGIFFAEWKFVTFLLVVGTPCAFFATLTMLLGLRFVDHRT